MDEKNDGTLPQKDEPTLLQGMADVLYNADATEPFNGSDAYWRHLADAAFEYVIQTLRGWADCCDDCAGKYRSAQSNLEERLHDDRTK